MGRPTSECPKCGGIYRTGQTEWVDLSTSRRLLFAVQVIWFLFTAAFWALAIAIVVVVIAAAAFKRQAGFIELGIISFAIAFPFFAAYTFLSVYNHVRRSIQRKPCPE